MTKKLQKYLAGIAADGKQYAYDGGYYVTDNYRIAEMTEPLPDVEVVTDPAKGKALYDWMRKASQRTEYDYIFCPASAEEIKAEVKALCGRKQTPVVWKKNETFPALNARWMAEALENLKADGFYVRGRKEPVFVYSEEIWKAGIAIMILPIVGYNVDDRQGFWMEKEAKKS